MTNATPSIDSRIANRFDPKVGIAGAGDGPFLSVPADDNIGDNVMEGWRGTGQLGFLSQIENAVLTYRPDLQPALSVLDDEQAWLDFDTAPEAMWLYDLATLRFVAVNQMAVARYGYARAEFLGMTLYDIRPPEDVPALLSSSALTGGGVEAGGVWRHRTKDGRLLRADILSFPVFYAGRPCRLVTARNVTDQRWAADALRDSEARYRQIVETAQEGIWLLDAHNQTTFVNQRLAEMLGYTVEEMLKTPLQLFLQRPDQAFAIANARPGRPAAGRPLGGDFRFRRKDGSALWGIVSTTPLFDQDGRYAGSLAMVTDISERKRAEARQLSQFAVTRVLAAYDSLPAASARLLQGICEGLGWELGELWCLDPANPQQCWHDLWIGPALPSAARHLLKVNSGLTRAGDWPALLRDSSQPLWFAEVTAEPGLTRAPLALTLGLRRGCAIPIRGSHGLSGLMLFLAWPGQQPSQPDQELLQLLADIGRQVNQFLVRIQAEETSRRQTARLRALVEVSKVFSADTLDSATVVETLVRHVADVTGDAAEVQLHLEATELVAGVGAARAAPAQLDAGPVVVALRTRFRAIGALTLFRDARKGPYTDDDERFLQDLADRAAQALDNLRLSQELAERERRLQDLVGQLLVAQEEERRRVAYDVHDGVAQVAIGTHQHLQAVARHYRPRSPQARDQFERALLLAQRTVREARQLVAHLRPTTLDDFGLASALRLQIEELRAEGWQITYRESLGAERLPPAVETALFRVAQEALTNVGKHAQTTAAQVTLARREAGVRLEVQDRGAGFDPATVSPTPRAGERVGLPGMRERLLLLGGRFRIQSRPGAGTRVLAEVPLPARCPDQGASRP